MNLPVYSILPFFDTSTLTIFKSWSWIFTCKRSFLFSICKNKLNALKIYVLKSILVLVPRSWLEKCPFSLKFPLQPHVQICPLESKIAGMEREKFKSHQFSVSHHFPWNVIHLGMYLCIQSVYLVNPHPPTSLKFPFNQSLQNKSLPHFFIICPNFFAVPAIT